MLVGLATWVILGHSERRRDAGETDDLINRKLSRARSTADCDPSCASVNSSPIARPAAKPRSWRRSCAAASPATTPLRSSQAGWSSPTSRSGRSGPDGAPRRTTRRRWPARSAPTVAEAGWGPTSRPTCRCSTAAASRPRTPANSWPSPAIDGALVGGASLKADEMAVIVARAGVTGRRPVRRRGAARDRPTSPDRPRCARRVRDRRKPEDDAIAQARMPVWRGLLAGSPNARPAGVGGGGRPAARADGQLRGRTPEPRRGQAGAARPATDRRRAPRRHVRRPAGAAARVRRARSARRPPAPDQPRRPWGRPRQRPPSRGDRRPRAPGGVAEVRVHALLDGRDTPPRSADRVRAGPRAASCRCPSGRADRDSRRAGTGRWTATTAGNGSRPVTTRSSTASGSARLRAERRSRRAYARGENDEFVRPTVIDGVDGRCGTATPSSTATSAPTARGSSRTPSPTRVRWL